MFRVWFLFLNSVQRQLNLIREEKKLICRPLSPDSIYNGLIKVWRCNFEITRGRFWFIKEQVPGMQGPATRDTSHPLYGPNNQDPSSQVEVPTRFLRTPTRRRRSTYRSAVDSLPESKEILSPAITLDNWRVLVTRGFPFLFKIFL